MNAAQRRYQFSLRTMFVLTVVVSIPLAWVGYSLNWIRERRAARQDTSRLWSVVSSDSIPNGDPAPRSLRPFGE